MEKSCPSCNFSQVIFREIEHRIRNIFTYMLATEDAGILHQDIQEILLYHKMYGLLQQFLVGVLKRESLNIDVFGVFSQKTVQVSAEVFQLFFDIQEFLSLEYSFQEGHQGVKLKCIFDDRGSFLFSFFVKIFLFTGESISLKNNEVIWLLPFSE